MPITNYYVASDAMDSATAILDEDGNVLERRSYDAFGEMNCMTPNGLSVATSPTEVDVGFQGQVRDEINGLYQMGFRWHNPSLGRWLNQDLINVDAGGDMYRYSGNRPNVSTDYFGLKEFFNDGQGGAEYTHGRKPNRGTHEKTRPARTPPNSNKQLPQTNGHRKYCPRKTCPKQFGPRDERYKTVLDNPAAWALDVFTEDILPSESQFWPILPDPVFVNPATNEFHWYGNYGGPGWTNGAVDSGSLLSYEEVGGSGAPLPTDYQDKCYYYHDIDHKLCAARSCTLQDLNNCIAKADAELSLCLLESLFTIGEKGRRRALFSSLVFAGSAVWHRIK
jgi:RHS repeat-associated protein